jgi:LuxR family maltose regulon positive regulatory protein
LLRQSELATLRTWLAALPEELVRSRPRLSLFHAWALVFSGQLEAVEAWLQHTELASGSAAEGGDIPGELTAIRASVAFFRRDLDRAITLYGRALAQLPEANLFLRGAVALSLATAYNLQGDMAGAKSAFAQASSLSEANNNIYTALIAAYNLAQLHVDQGQLHRAAELYRQALQLASQEVEQGRVCPASTGRVHVGLAEVLYQWNELDRAGQHLTGGMQMGQQHGDAIALMRGYLTLAQIKQAQGDMKGAFELIGTAETYARENNLPSWHVRLTACRVRYWLAQNNLTAAVDWLEIKRSDRNGDSADDSAGYPDELRQVERLTQARLWIALGRTEEALALLARLRQSAADKVRTGCLLEILTVQALAYQAQNNFVEAVTTLEKALALARPEDYVRLFLDEGAPMAALLTNVTDKGGLLAEYISRLLAVFDQAGIQPAAFSPYPPTDPLSDRELELLNLIATGLSNQQIADKLVLTVGTVKWHLSNIYSKLGVSSRTQAVARARDLRLL